MKRKELWLLLSLLLVVFWSGRCWSESRFFRMKCLEGGMPGNLAIVSDGFGQVFLEFDSEDLHNYVIESTDSLWP